MHGFVTPETVRHIHLYPWAATGGGGSVSHRPTIWARRFISSARVFGCAPVSTIHHAFEACTKLVREQGGDEFFERPDWEMELRRLAQSSPGIRESPPSATLPSGTILPLRAKR